MLWEHKSSVRFTLPAPFNNNNNNNNNNKRVIIIMNIIYIILTVITIMVGSVVVGTSVSPIAV